MKEKREMRGVRAAILDLDGTLFDSSWLWGQIDIDFLKKRGLVPTEEYQRALGALSNRQTAYFTIEYYHLSDTAEQLMEEWENMALFAYEHSIKLFDGAREYVEDMHARGIKLIAVTSLAVKLATAGLKSNGIFELFAAVVSADETEFSKTSPEMYLHASKIAGEPVDACVAFDDVEAALKSAKAAGMRTVGIVGDGFHFCGDTADCTVDTIADAPKMIKQLG